MLPGTALMPAMCQDLDDAARRAGELRPRAAAPERRVVTKRRRNGELALFSRRGGVSVGLHSVEAAGNSDGAVRPGSAARDGDTGARWRKGEPVGAPAFPFISTRPF